MSVPLVILTDARDPRPRRELRVVSGTRILTAAHEAGVDITATCGGQALEVRGLMMLVTRQRDFQQLLGNPGVDDDGRRARAHAGARAEDLE